MNRGRRFGSGRLFERAGAWWVDWRDELGQRRRLSVGTSKRDAERVRVELVAKRDRVLRGLDVAPQDVALDDLRERYLADLATRSTVMHLRNVEPVLVRWLTVLPARSVREVQPADVLAFRAKLLRDGRSNRNANYHLACLRAMLRWAVDVGLVSENPLRRVKQLPDGPKQQRRRRRAIGEDELARFLKAVEDEDAAYASTVRPIPQGPLWYFLLETGARYGEARQVTWADLDAKAGVVHLRAEVTKAGRSRVIPLRTELVERLQALRPVHERVLKRPLRDGDYVFLSSRGYQWCRPSNNLRRCFMRLIDAAGIPRIDEQGRRVDIHAMRHTAASRLARAGVPSLVTMRILGHASSRITQEVYSHVEIEDLRGAIERVPAVGV